MHKILVEFGRVVFSARCNIYISRLCYNVSVRLSVPEVHWRIIANLGFKFRSQFTVDCGRGLMMHAGAREGIIAGKSGSSRTMLATSRPSCFCCFRTMTQPSILHLDQVVNWKVFTIYICCFIAKILFHISIFTIFSISP